MFYKKSNYELTLINDDQQLDVTKHPQQWWRFYYFRTFRNDPIISQVFEHSNAYVLILHDVCADPAPFLFLTHEFVLILRTGSFFN